MSEPKSASLFRAEGLQRALRKHRLFTNEENISQLVNAELSSLVEAGLQTIQAGGRIVFPSEYYGVESGSYQATAGGENENKSTASSLVSTSAVQSYLSAGAVASEAGQTGGCGCGRKQATEYANQLGGVVNYTLMKLYGGIADASAKNNWKKMSKTHVQKVVRQVKKEIFGK